MNKSFNKKFLFGIVGFLLVLLVLFKVVPFTVVNFRSPFNPGTITSEGEGFRCVELLSEQTIPVSFKLSTPPSSSLQSISLSVGKKGEELFELGGECVFSYLRKSSVGVNVNSFNVKDLKPCSPTISCVRKDSSGNVIDSSCSNDGVKTNPNCPISFYDVNDWVLTTVEGVVELDESINSFVCVDNNPKIPYQCYSNVCGGRDLLVKDMKACFYNPSFSSDELVVVKSDVSNVNIFWRFMNWLKTFFGKLF